MDNMRKHSFLPKNAADHSHYQLLAKVLRIRSHHLLTAILLFTIGLSIWTFIRLEVCPRRLSRTMDNSVVVMFTPRVNFTRFPSNIAIGCSIKTDDGDISVNSTSLADHPFFTTLLPSFCRTASLGYNYYFYITYETADPLLKHMKYRIKFRDIFEEIISEKCRFDIPIELRLRSCNYTGRPSWNVNDAIMEGYLDNLAYFYKVHPRMQMLTKDWTDSFVKTLYHMNPPNLGIVGPSVAAPKIGHEHSVLNHGFVHRTHIRIFGFYYPRTIKDHHAEKWITSVYFPHRSVKLKDVAVKLQDGNSQTFRSPDSITSQMLNYQLHRDRETLQRWLQVADGGEGQQKGPGTFRYTHHDLGV